jgi:hypothetical protein
MAAVTHGGGGFTQRRTVGKTAVMAGTLTKGEDKEQLEAK